MTVSRETVERLGERYDLGPGAAVALDALLDALANEPAPPTTVTDPSEAVDRHLADSLSGLEVPALATARRIADIGAGAGFPGLALAIALPDASVDLIESTVRKCEVIDRLARAAGVANARAVPARAEELALTAAGSYDAVTARALAALPVLVEYAAPLLRMGGTLVAWKGDPDEAEEDSGRRAAELVGLEPREPLAVRPFPSARARSLHTFVKRGETPSRFPRRAGMAAKRPLA